MKKKRNLSEETRRKFSERGKRRCIESRKFWTKPERLFKEILNLMGIGVRFSKQVKEILNLEDDLNAEIDFQLSIQRYVCDFVDQSRKIIYSVNGDYWHANPSIYKNVPLTKVQEHNIRQDYNRRIFLEKNGYIVCEIWENDIYHFPQVVMEKVWASRKVVHPSDLHSEKSTFDSLVAYFKPKIRKPKVKKPKIKKSCLSCNNNFEVASSQIKRKFCSQSCAKFNRRKVIRPSKDELLEDLKVLSLVKVGEKYGVSDKAVAKWLKYYQ